MRRQYTTTEKKDRHDRQVEKILEQLTIFSAKCHKDHLSKQAHIEGKKPNWEQSRNRNRQKEPNLKSAEVATAARSKLHEIAYNQRCICNIAYPLSATPQGGTISIEVFKKTFFPDKYNQEYERLNPLMKVLLAQYLIHRQRDTNLKPYPFVFRLPTNLHGCNQTELNKKIQRKLTKVLGRPAQQMWTYKEYDGDGYRNLNKIITHINGEILINPDERKKLKEAFKNLAGGTITINPSLPYAIRLPMGSRKKQWSKYGEFYSVFNWCSYATKQDLERSIDARRTWFDCRLQKKPTPAPDKSNYHYISSDLNKMASQFYSENILKRVSKLSIPSNTQGS